MNADYLAFRRYLEACVEDDHNAVTVIDLPNGEKAYIVPQARYAEMREKAEAYDLEHGVPITEEDAAEEVAIRSFLSPEI